jgi:hypothetical protein
MSVRNAGEAIRDAVLAWSDVTARPHRFGGTEYHIGKREIGHVHGDTLVDIPFPTKVRDELVKAGPRTTTSYFAGNWLGQFLHEQS